MRGRAAVISLWRREAVTKRCAAEATDWPSKTCAICCSFTSKGLPAHEVEISPLAAVPVESRIGDGRTIHLPATVAEFGDDQLDFRLYKVLAAHAAGQIEFGTYEQGTPALRAAYATLAETYAAENQMPSPPSLFPTKW